VDEHRNGARERIHLPAPSLIPLATAVGITVALVGLILSWLFVVLGSVIFLIAVLRWVKLVRQEMASLPSDRR
jgi:hypothetical protein